MDASAQQVIDKGGDKVYYFENFDLENIETPINIEAYSKLLKASKYDCQKSQFLLQGFKQGFSIGYQGLRQRKAFSNNIPLSVGLPTELWNKVMKEVKLKRFAGPFEEPPFKYFIQSPIGLVLKDNGKQTRLIFHLSFDFGPEDKDRFLNFHTPEDICSVKYKDLDTAVELCLKLINSKGFDTEEGLIIFSKSDLKSAFRIVPCRTQDFNLLMMKVKHPITKKTYFFADKNLPFGSSIS